MKTKWHNIAKESPNENKDYLVCDKNGVMFTATYGGPRKEIWCINGSNELYYGDEGYLRFWCELPDEPEGLSY